MGVRGNNHIKIIRNSLKPIILENIDINKLTPVFTMDMSAMETIEPLYLNTLISKNNLSKINDADLNLYKKIYEKVRDSLKGKELTIPKFFDMIYSILYNGKSFNDNSWPFGKIYFDELTEAGIFSGLLETSINPLDKNEINYSNTVLASKFLMLFDELEENIPFEWNNFVQRDYDKSLDKFCIGADNLISINTDLGKYILTMETWNPTNDYVTNTKHTSLILIDNPKAQMSSMKREVNTLEDLCANNHTNRKSLQKIFADTKNSINRTNNIAMSPLSTNTHYSIFQGIINDQPIFVNVNNNELFYCRNTYGAGLKIVLDPESRSENNNFSKIYVMRDDQIVFSRDAYTIFPTKKPINEEQEKIYSIAYNMNRLNNL